MHLGPILAFVIEAGGTPQSMEADPKEERSAVNFGGNRGCLDSPGGLYAPLM